MVRRLAFTLMSAAALISFSLKAYSQEFCFFLPTDCEELSCRPYVVAEEYPYPCPADGWEFITQWETYKVNPLQIGDFDFDHGTHAMQPIAPICESDPNWDKASNACANVKIEVLGGNGCTLPMGPYKDGTAGAVLCPN